ncbi:hypothetical protein [Streptomyces collinus]|uniref:Uncharacterized protein n=1 Tax=Streptomyces collinus (strain DSM 40733 / Tue 365) TaxID=1214242 RepID=S5UX50_STRC3|nr:hypothetical protein [Streptomyces collinus]AGS71813.1 hypothetical protein B446_25010 [Streptomyces collinus Tu 365]UJA10461.1 hypothetical protein HGI10_44250 [Streptomyces collinus]UJA14675.1 hypothetical protein HGI09_19870 [Streptomyces collinus]
MTPKSASTPEETRIALEGGTYAVLTVADVAVAALRTAEDEKYDVLAAVGGKNLPALVLMRNALQGKEPANTNAAEKALRELGFSILVRRRFDNVTGEPVRLTREQINNSSI